MGGIPSGGGVRHSILDLAPLELDCMNALWPVGEATVRDIQQALAATRPRAYTTIMTILDRLAQKGVVVRRKCGRAWMYRPHLSADEARTHALTHLVNGFFSGSTEALAKHLSAHDEIALVAGRPIREERHAAEPQARRALRREQLESPAAAPQKPEPSGLDTSLL